MNKDEIQVVKTEVESSGNTFKISTIFTIDQSGSDSGISHGFNILVLTIAFVSFFGLSGFWWWLFFILFTGFMSFFFCIFTTILASIIVFYQFFSFLYRIFS